MCHEYKLECREGDMLFYKEKRPENQQKDWVAAWQSDGQTIDAFINQLDTGDVVLDKAEKPISGSDKEAVRQAVANLIACPW